MKRLALGFRVKSGYAIAVALRGPASAPQILGRVVVELSDPTVRGTRQPYHDGFFKEERDPRAIAARVKIVKRCAKRSIASLLNDDRFAGLRCRRAGLVVGSLIDPQTVGNLHIRAHASEGQLFRTVLIAALRSHGVSCDVVVDKTMPVTAAKALRRSNAQIRKTVAALGQAWGGSWRADDKAACTAAWIALA